MDVRSNPILYFSIKNFPELCLTANSCFERSSFELAYSPPATEKSLGRTLRITMNRLLTWLFTLVLALAASSFAQTQDAEAFDVSGMPAQPDSFSEQKLLEKIATPKHGDLRNAARIQSGLSTYYQKKGDAARLVA